MTSRLNEIIIRLGAMTLCASLLLNAAVARGVERDTTPENADIAQDAAKTAATEAETASALAEGATNVSTVSTGKIKTSGIHASRDIVEFGRSVELKAGDTAKDLVVIGNSANVHGKVRGSLVVIGGNITLDGEVGQDVVAVMGSVKLGTNANVHHDTVAVMGGVKLEPGAHVHHDTIAVGGRVDRPDGAEIGGQVVSVTLPGLGWLGEMGDWVTQCVFKLRLLSFHVGWVWVVAGIFLLLYLLVALAFPRPVEACAEEITRRPATTLLMGLLTKLLIPIVTLILVATGIGVFVVPFLGAAVFIAGVIGKVALLAYFGRQLGRSFGAPALQRLLVPFFMGWIIVTLLYVVPVLGLIIYFVTGMWALGAAMTAIFGGMRRETPKRPTSPPATTGFAPTMPVPASPAAPAEAPLAATSMASNAESGPTPQAVPGGVTAPVSEALAFPRANFWERMGAAFLDVVLVGILGGLVGGPPLGFLVALAYFAGMWTWKGTTIGGIVLNLKVVRLDGGPMTFAAALVRGLAAAFSVIVLFLGFLWIIWDDEKQGWHDRIAGTVVVRLPRGTSLVCV